MIPCTLPPCSVCDESPENFKRHEARERQFRFLIDQIVHIEPCLVIRWKCPLCIITFTQCPPFALPHKRYLLPTFLFYAHAYVTDPSATYRKLVDEKPLEYADNSGQELVHSSVHRWVGALGGMPDLLAHAQDLIMQKNPASSVARDAAGFSVSSRKYRSTERKNLLERAIQLFFVATVFRETFGKLIFPVFGTRSGFM